MKNKKVLIISVISIVLVVGIISLDATITNYHMIRADRVKLADSFDELQNGSDLIIKATILTDKENKLDVLDDGSVIFGYTITQLQVEDVYYGATSINDIIKITEEYYVTDLPIGKTINTQGNYLPAKVGNQYIFFLKKYHDDTRYKGMYFPIDLENGKYLINDKTKKISAINNLSNKELEIGTRDATKYKEFFIKVLEKYSKK